MFVASSASAGSLCMLSKFCWWVPLSLYDTGDLAANQLAEDTDKSLYSEHHVLQHLQTSTATATVSGHNNNTTLSLQQKLTIKMLLLDKYLQTFTDLQ